MSWVCYQVAGCPSGNDALMILSVGLCLWQVRNSLTKDNHHRSLQSCRYFLYVCVSQKPSEGIVFWALLGGCS